MIEHNNMNGKIKGKSIWSFVLELDWTLKKTEDRIKLVEKILGKYEIDGVAFYHEYFEEVFNQDNPHSKVKLLLGTNSVRYDESNISKALEIIESYILCTDEEKELRNKDKIKYKIYNSKELFDRFKQEERLIYKLSSVNSDRSNNYDKGDYRRDKENENVFEIFQLPKGYKKAKDILIKKSDIEKYPILKDYQNSIDYLKNKLEELSKIDENEFEDEESLKEFRQYKNMIRRNLKSLKIDMLDIKKMILKPIDWKSPLKDSGSVDYDELDMFDKNTVKELLRVHKQIDLQDDLSCILVDLDNLINKIDFTYEQLKLLEGWRNGVNLDIIGKELNVNKGALEKRLDTIINMIIKQYEEDYENWYYLNIRKGQYKKCSRCGEIKLISQFDKNGKKRLRSSCKRCESERKK